MKNKTCKNCKKYDIHEQKDINKDILACKNI